METTRRFDPSQDGGTTEVEFAVATSRAEGNSGQAPAAC